MLGGVVVAQQHPGPAGELWLAGSTSTGHKIPHVKQPRTHDVATHHLLECRRGKYLLIA